MGYIMNKIIQGDCLEVLKDMPDKSVDLVLTDPPYGKRPTRGKNGFGSAQTIKHQPEDDRWDVKPTKEYFDEIKRVSKNQIIWGGNYFTTLIREDNNCWLIWDKMTGNNPYADAELAWTSFNKVTKIYKEQWLGALIKEEILHPTQKSSKLFQWCILNYSNENDIILDPFLGSGTTAIACIKTNRNYIGIEKEPKYVEIARKRVEEELSQMKLF